MNRLLTERLGLLLQENRGAILLQNNNHMAGITKIDASTVKFIGQSDIVIFKEVEDYETATLASILVGGQSLGQIDGDSTEWTGEEATMENRVDEQGDIISTTTTKGTLSWAADVASTSQKMMETFLKGKVVEVPEGGKLGDAITDVKSITKLGIDLPVMTRPIAIINDEANRIILFPKAKILGDPSIEDKMLVIGLQVTAEYIDVNDLGTAVVIDGKPTYEDGVTAG